VAAIEGIIEDMAQALNKDALDIRRLNVYREGFDKTHYGQTVENNLLPKLFEDLEASCDYRERRKAIAANNQKALQSNNKFSDDAKFLRGLSMTAVKFGISFTTRFLNQGNALLQLHRDGSIQVSTGAVEMGQGVNTRIAMLVAEELGVSLDLIRVMSTATDKNANTSPTAASTGTDINGAAALKAAREIKKRLAALAVKLKDLNPEKWPSKTAGLGTAPEVVISDIFEKAHELTKFCDNRVSVAGGFSLSMKELINEAYLNRISLGEYGYHRTENLGFDKLSGQGQAFHYFTQGTAASEVEVNRLTGEIKVRRVDILMDLGRPINEGLDLGQVTGAFIQGMGWVTTENLVYNKEGFLLSHSPSTYKIPSVQDTPRVFNVKLAHNLDNIVNVRGTKAVGEPPLLLSLSVWTAVKDAIRYVSDYNPATLAFNLQNTLPIPATAEEALRHLDPEAFSLFEQDAK
jgi:xanthine dehydrogenase large subunit